MSVTKLENTDELSSGLAPDDDGYAAAHRAWNLSARHRPALVVMAENAEDVQRAVRYARSADLGVSVMATGHGTGTPNDGGVLVNTSRMRDIQVNPAARVARVAAGDIWSDMVAAAAAHGLAGLPGSSTTVGVVGYTLGGGFGWLGRRYGLAAHSVIRAEVVTADGELVVASAYENPDLFWALRGGTGNFGIVTALEFALHQVTTVYAGNLYFPLERARDVAEVYAGWSAEAADELTSSLVFRRFPPAPTVPELLRGRSFVAVRGSWCGDLEAGRGLVDQARAALGPATVDTFAPIPVANLAAVSMDPVDPLPVLNRTELIRDLTPGTIDALLDLAGPDSGSPLVMLEARQLGGALGGPPDALSPMAHTTARFSLNAIGMTATAEQTDAVRAHLEKVGRRLQPYVTGETYLNFLDLDGATPERIRAAYSAADWQRLLALKEHYDPTDVFRFNRNIAASNPTTHRK